MRTRHSPSRLTSRRSLQVMRTANSPRILGVAIWFLISPVWLSCPVSFLSAWRPPSLRKSPGTSFPVRSVLPRYRPISKRSWRTWCEAR